MLARRQILKGVAGWPLATVLANPALARSVAASLPEVEIRTAAGRSVTATFAQTRKASAPTVLLVHEWWGLNDQIKAVAAEFAGLGYHALAVDLYDGNVGTTRDEARSYMKSVKSDEAVDTLVSWAAWLKKHENASGKIGTVGWCFGGGWSLMTGIKTPVDATVVYYGNVARTATELKSLKGPVLGHFASRDKWINQKMVSGFEKEMTSAGKALTVHWYEADHAFANPTSARYDEGDAKLAWQRTQTFFEQHLGS
ncbi:MAG: dienelactone hydrolase family protein [Alphaproteobacteria bacterium]|jgi:carboxymethylenebutenolidase|nr:dienelactone hydrolase family protein [Alphaproteobacteria bacterium]